MRPTGYATWFGRSADSGRRAVGGVTLFELVVVVLVTAFLAVLLIFSTNMLVVRTKLSRVKEEQRVLARALQNYQMDHSRLPAESTGLRSLVAPTAYLASVPVDPFLKDSDRETYFYFNPDGSGQVYAIVSAGPNGRLDVLDYLAHARSGGGRNPSGGGAATAPPAGASSPPSGDRSWFEDYLVQCTYDPTNGTVSRGDIITLIHNF